MTTPNALFRKMLSDRIFPITVCGTIFASGVIGWATYNYFIPSTNNKVHVEHDDAYREISENEAIVTAMVQIAKESTFRENMQRSTVAMERLVLPPNHPASSHPTALEDDFLNELAQRSASILKDQQERRQQNEVFNNDSKWGKE